MKKAEPRAKTKKPTARAQTQPAKDQPVAKSKSSLMSYWSIMLLIALTFAVYSLALDNGFIYDDESQVLENKFIQDTKYIPKIFTTNVWAFMDKQALTNYYRPMMHLAYMLDYHLFGLKPFGFHLTNILFHILSTIMVYFLTVELFKDKSFGLLAGLLFALHPIHTEAVIWIAALPELLVTFFYLLSLYLYLKAETAATLSKKIHLAISLLCFLLALLSKEMALTLPLILIVYEHIYRKRAWREGPKRYGAYFAVVGLYALLRIHALGQFLVTQHHHELKPYEFVLSVVATVGKYWWKLFLPTELNAFHVFEPSRSILELPVLAALVAIVIAIGLMLKLWPRQPMIVAGIAWVLITLMPVLNIKAIGPNVFAERYLYIPSVGFCWLAAQALTWLVAEARVIRLLMVGVLLTLSAFQIVARTKDWKDAITFYRKTVASSPNAYIMRNELGLACYKRGLLDQAIQEFREAARSKPDFVEAHNNLGTVYQRKGLVTEAIKEYQEVLRLKPDRVQAHNNLGAAYRDQGRLDDAMAEYQAALRIDPDYLEAHHNLGVAYQNKGWLDQAIEEYKKAIAINSQAADTRANLGAAYFDKGLIDAAIAEYQEALRIKPESASAHFNLAVIYSRKGAIEQAIEEYRRAVQVKPNYADAHYQLALLCHNRGRIDQAISEYTHVLRLNPNYPEARENLERAKGQLNR
jgi:tetratricopeptide (TPR) repeat protein